MTIDIVCAGHALSSDERAWVDDYIRRSTKYARVKIHRVKETPRAWKEMEKSIRPKSFRIVLDETGKQVSTAELAKYFDKDLTFVIGGSYGLPPEAKESSDALISLSRLTLPHRIALLVLAEQIYRVLSWRAGSPYHHA